MDPQVTRNLGELAPLLKEEYSSIKADRDHLRNWTFKNTNFDDSTHLPVNIARLILNSKQQYCVKSDGCPSDLQPDYVIKKVQELIQNLSIVQGASKGHLALIEVNKNAKELFCA